MVVHTLEPQMEEALKPGLFTAMAKGRSAKKAAEEEEADDEDEGDEDEADDWESGDDEEDSWDPDFEEFDLPKSKKGGGSKKEADADEDFKIEEDPEFKDLFSGGGGNDFDDEDEDF